MNELKKAETKVQKFWHMLGPGLTTGAADDDPAGITTYTQAGASFGYQMLWTAGLTFPLMAIVQEMCARIGLVTGRGLASAIRLYFPRWFLYLSTLLLFSANTFNIGADLGMMARAFQLIFPNTNALVMVVVFALASLWMQIALSYKDYAKYLKWLALILFVYVFAAFSVYINWPQALKSFAVPRINFDLEHLLILTAVLGTTISPYLFFWQTSQEVEEEIMEGKTTIKKRIEASSDEIKKMRLDVWSGMLFSNLVMFFIIAVCASTLFAAGIVNIKDPAAAVAALKPLAGNAAYLFFTLGIIGTGLLAVPVLAGSSSYAISESFGWREGLYRKFKQAHAFYGVIVFSMIVGLVMNFLHLDPIKMLIYSGVLNAFIAPFILVPIVLIASNRNLMKEWANGSWSKFLGWLVIALMSLVSILTIWYIIY